MDLLAREDQGKMYKGSLNYCELPELKEIKSDVWEGHPQWGEENSRKRRITSNLSLYSISLNVEVL